MLRHRLPGFAVAAGLVLTMGVPARTQSPSASQHWVATWGTAQQIYRAAPAVVSQLATPPAPPATPPPTPAAPPAAPTPASPPTGPQRRFPVPPGLPGLKNQTIRMIVRSSLGGRTVRVRLSQAFGAPTITLGAAHLAVRGADSAIISATDRVLTFSGKPSATLYGGQLLVSDPVNLDVKPNVDLAVSLYFPEDTGAPTSHTFGLRPTYISREGDVTGATTITDIAQTMQSYYWLTGIDVLAPMSAGTVVTFGDSITDGDQSTPDTVGMWPALLAARLQATRATSSIGVVNAGISGNRILGNNTSGLARLMHDALAVPGVKWITLLEGINDITGATRPGAPPSTFSAGTLIAAYQQVIDTAHLYGVKVIGCTITPYGGSNVYSAAGESIRQAANAWIRAPGHFDGVIDFDAATRDAADPTRFRAAADSPDMLHPGDAGYKLMAEAIRLTVFK